MLVKTVLITLERVAPWPTTLARVTGATMIIAGAIFVFRQGI